VLFAVPLEVAEIWPWPLTELTGRAIAAWLVALGGLLAAVAWEGDRSRIRLATWTVMALVALQAVALARFGEELDISSASALVYIASLLCLGATGAWGSRISTG
jgi:hypothetical protein